MLKFDLDYKAKVSTPAINAHSHKMDSQAFFFAGWKDRDWAFRVPGRIPTDSEDTEVENKETRGINSERQLQQEVSGQSGVT